MRPAVQKPDTNTPEIRRLLSDLRVRGMLDYLEAPVGLGCDYVVFLRGLLLFLEVKRPGRERRMTAAEVRLQALCKHWLAAEYCIVTDTDQLLSAIYGRWETG